MKRLLIHAAVAMTMSVLGCYVPQDGGGSSGTRRTTRSTDSSQSPTDIDPDDDLPKREPEPEPEPSDAEAPLPPPDAAPAVTAFGDAPSYAPITPPTQSARHDGYMSNAGQDCTSCHNGQTPGVPRFVIAGTVYATQGSTIGAKNVQVRIVAPNGDEVALVGTDDSGNFWLKAGAVTEIPLGSVVGVRNGISTRLMGGKIGGPSVSAGSCNRAGCHAPGNGIYVD